ncbi:MAG: hypothetical protein LR015_04785 [Verrucomicrobia bacterium]|nr:hypothetical protein [Verrucomicrobiota bacterium]
MVPALKYKNQYLEKISPVDLVVNEEKLDWNLSAWGAGAWNDGLGTAAYHDLKYHQGKFDLSTLFGWLNLNCCPATGVWESEPKPINGFSLSMVSTV